MGNATLTVIIAIIIMLVVMGTLSFALANTGDDAKGAGQGVFGAFWDMFSFLGFGGSPIALQSFELKDMKSDKLMFDVTLRRAKDYVIFSAINGVEQPNSYFQTNEKDILFNIPDLEVNLPSDFTGNLRFSLYAVRDGKQTKTPLVTKKIEYLRPNLPGIESWLGINNLDKAGKSEDFQLFFSLPDYMDDFYDANKEFFQNINTLCRTAEDFCCSGNECNEIIKPCTQTAVNNNFNNHINIYTFGISGGQIGCSKEISETPTFDETYETYVFCSREFLSTLKSSIQSCSGKRNDVEYSSGVYVKW